MNKMGRPPYQPTEKDRQQVKTLAAMGVPDYDIAKVMQLSGPTLRKHFFHELESGHIEANANVAQSLFKMATDSEKPNVSAAIFWLKTRARWSEAKEEELGKKEIARIAAESAGTNTEWENLLN